VNGFVAQDCHRGGMEVALALGALGLVIVVLTLAIGLEADRR
jgi:hypothetical protein